MSEDKKAAYETLYECLMVTAQLMSPIAPFYAEWLYKNLTDNIREKAVANRTPLTTYVRITSQTLIKAEQKPDRYFTGVIDGLCTTYLFARSLDSEEQQD